MIKLQRVLGVLGYWSLVFLWMLELATWRLILDRSAHEATTAQRKSPWQMRGATDANALVRYDIGRHFCVASETVSGVGTQIHFMMTIGDGKRLRQFAWT